MTETQFHKFFDDAAVFPPGLAPLEVAVREHIKRAANDVTDAFIGPIILPLGKVLEAAKLTEGEPLDISIVVPAGELPDVDNLLCDLKAQFPAIIISALEIKVGEDAGATIEAIAETADFMASHPDLQLFAELPYPLVNHANLVALKEAGLALKFRTGGVSQELFPTPPQIIDVIGQALFHELPFKLTAGLHRAMRYTDGSTNFRHYGFANIAAVTAALRNGASTGQALNLLNTDDPGIVAETLAEESDWRENFISFGTCSVAEPAQTLAEIGLVHADTAAHF